MAGGYLGALFGVEMAETGGRADASPKALTQKGQGKGKARTKRPAKAEAAALAAPASSKNARAKSAKSQPTDSTPAAKPLPTEGAVRRAAPNAARKIRGRSSPMAKGAARILTEPIAAAAKTSGAWDAIESKVPKNAAVRTSAAKKRHAIGQS